MRNFLIDATNINKDWDYFQDELKKELQYIFINNFFVFEGLSRVNNTQNPLNYLHLKFFMIKAQCWNEKDILVNDKTWIWTAAIIHQIEELCNRTVDKYDFRFFNVENKDTQNPIFIIQVAEENSSCLTELIEEFS